MRLAGKVALVTGGGSGIGRGCAIRFGEEGADVVIADVNRVAAESVAGEVRKLSARAHAVDADVTSGEDCTRMVREAVEQFGKLDVFMANAGIARGGTVLELSEDDWNAVIETNLTGTFRVAKRAAKGMLRQRKGRLIFISSVVGLLGSAGQVNYAASKAGLVGMARSLARELGSRSITANVVAPGFVETDMTAVLTDEQQATIKDRVPLARYATPDEIAAAVTWLAGDGAAYVTGAAIPVDGGLGMGH